MNIPFSDLRKQYESIKSEIDSEMKKVIESSSFVNSSYNIWFEKKFAEYCCSKYCIGVNSGTAALFLSLKAAGIREGDEVITTPMTFTATAEVISALKAKPVFADIDKKTFNIDPEKIKEKITEKTRAIVPVHLYGNPCSMAEIIETAEKYGLIIVEDCCQAHGAEYKGKKLPVSGIGCFSFYPSKNLGAYGDAGAVVTNNDEIAEKVSLLKDHGRKTKYEHIAEGFNERMDSIQAAVLNVKLKYLDKWIEKRREIAERYNESLSGIKGLILPCETANSKHVYHLYCIKTKKRNELMDLLAKNGISTGVHYPIPLHLQKAYSYLGLKKGSLPVSEEHAEQSLSLPLYPEMTEEQIERVAEKVRELSSI